MNKLFYYGVDYYPEHWPEDRWDEDARLMQAAGINVARLAEFAWSKLEPREGQFDFAWLDRAIDTLAARGIKTVLGTPTASPPPWIMAQHPDAFIVREDGTRATYGSRREYCPTNEDYLRHSVRITRPMAEHYQTHPHVIGWQIDNEFGDRCYCPGCRKAFQAWLEQRYGTLDNLNARWGTVFWSHVYSDWSQIPLPWTTSGIPNPSLALDYYRFMSDVYGTYQQAQVDILRAVCPRHFITHNLMGFRYGRLNYFDLAAPLDFVTWDNYPRGFWTEEDPKPGQLALGHVTMRGLKRRNFWVMEAQAGISGWDIMGITPRPGELRLWAYQGMAHGADGIVYFRWRTCRFGAEQYWHGVLDHDGRPRRRYAEIVQMGQELARIGQKIVDLETRAEVAVMLDYDTRFAFQIQPNTSHFNYPDHLASYYLALHRRNVPTDIIAPTSDLSPYRLVIVPALYLVGQEVANRLQDYVARGGVLVVTTRSGVKDETNIVVNLPLPGRLADLCGVEVEDCDSAPVNVVNPLTFEHPSFGETAKGWATTWFDVLKPMTATVVARYTQHYYASQPAITVHNFGRGQAIYVGTVGDETLVQTVVNGALALAAVEPLLDTPANVEVTARWQGDRRLLFILNHNPTAQRVTLDRTYYDLLKDEHVGGEIELAARDVLILAESDTV